MHPGKNLPQLSVHKRADKHKSGLEPSRDLHGGCFAHQTSAQPSRGPEKWGRAWRQASFESENPLELLGFESRNSQSHFPLRFGHQRRRMADSVVLVKPVLCAMLLLMHATPSLAGCFEAKVAPKQGLCTQEYNIKVCAKDQEAANAYVETSHGVIVRANCRKALTVLCGDVGGGEPSDNLEDVCCMTANQCETDAHCGDVVDPSKVSMCCSYCQSMYDDACEASQPVNAGFTSIVQLYDTFHAAQIMEKCTAGNGISASTQCVPERKDGVPCMARPAADEAASRRRKEEKMMKRRKQAAISQKRQYGSSGASSVGRSGARGGLVYAAVLSLLSLALPVVRTW